MVARANPIERAGPPAPSGVGERRPEEHDDEAREGERDLQCLLHHFLPRVLPRAFERLDEPAKFRVVHLLGGLGFGQQVVGCLTERSLPHLGESDVDHPVALGCEPNVSILHHPSCLGRIPARIRGGDRIGRVLVTRTLAVDLDVLHLARRGIQPADEVIPPRVPPEDEVQSDVEGPFFIVVDRLGGATIRARHDVREAQGEETDRHPDQQHRGHQPVETHATRLGRGHLEVAGHPGYREHRGQETRDGEGENHLVRQLVEIERRDLGLPHPVREEVVETVGKVDDLEEEWHAKHADQEDLEELADHVPVEDPHPPAFRAWKNPATPMRPNRILGLHIASAGDRNCRSASFSPPISAT